MIAPSFGLTEDLITSFFEKSQQLEVSYIDITTKVFKKSRKQKEIIEAGIDEMKQRFVDYLSREDSKQEKLDQFINSFNRFTEEFGDLRPDQQTKDELLN